MTQYEIIVMARQAGLVYGSDTNVLGSVERFAKLVAQHEREACWNDISIALLGSDRELTKRVFKAIRARSKE